MNARIQLQALFKAISLLVLFVTFFSEYFFFQTPLLEAFVKGAISLFISIVVLNIIYGFWRLAFSNAEWKLIIEGPIETDAEDSLESVPVPEKSK